MQTPEIRQDWCLWCGKRCNQSEMFKTNYKKYEGMAGFKQDVYYYTCTQNRECVTNNSEYPQ